MKSILLVLLFPVYSFASLKCYVVEEVGTKKPVKVCSTQRPKKLVILGEIDREIDYFKPIKKWVKDPLEPAKTIEVTEYVFDPAKKAQAEADAALAKLADRDRRLQNAAELDAALDGTVDTVKLKAIIRRLMERAGEIEPE